VNIDVTINTDDSRAFLEACASKSITSIIYRVEFQGLRVIDISPGREQSPEGLFNEAELMMRQHHQWNDFEQRRAQCVIGSVHNATVARVCSDYLLVEFHELRGYIERRHSGAFKMCMGRYEISEDSLESDDLSEIYDIGDEILVKITEDLGFAVGSSVAKFTVDLVEPATLSALPSLVQ